MSGFSTEWGVLSGFLFFLLPHMPWVHLLPHLTAHADSDQWRLCVIDSVTWGKREGGVSPEGTLDIKKTGDAGVKVIFDSVVNANDFVDNSKVKVLVLLVLSYQKSSPISSSGTLASLKIIL